MNLQHNTILVTGGTGGFGFEFASKLIALGNTVIITGRNIEKLEAVKQKLPSVHTIQSDVSKAEDIENLKEQVVRQFPNLNIIINNAGEMRKLALQQEHDLTDITREIEINLMGPIRMIQAFLPHLKKQKSAAIVNVSPTFTSKNIFHKNQGYFRRISNPKPLKTSNRILPIWGNSICRTLC